MLPATVGDADKLNTSGTMATLPTVREPGHNGGMASATSYNGGGVGSSATTSRTERKLAVLKKLRAPPLTHEWEFWHDR